MVRVAVNGVLVAALAGPPDTATITSIATEANVARIGLRMRHSLVVGPLDRTASPAPTKPEIPGLCADAYEPGGRAILAPSSARDRIPSFRYTRDRTSSTLFGAMNTAAATSRVVRPRAASSATCRSVAVSASGAGGRRPTRLSSWRALAAHSDAPRPSKLRRAAVRRSFAARFSFRRRRISPATSVVRAASNGSGAPS